MTTSKRSEMFSSYLSSQPKVQNSGISGHHCFGPNCPVCAKPSDAFQRMSDNLDAQNKLALESGTLPPEEEAILREVTYPELLHASNVGKSVAASKILNDIRNAALKMYLESELSNVYTNLSQEDRDFFDVTYEGNAVVEKTMLKAYVEMAKEGETFIEFQKRYAVIEKNDLILIDAYSPSAGAYSRLPPGYSGFIGQNVMLREPELDSEPEAIEPEFTPKQKRPPSRLVQALMGRIDPTQHLWYKDYLK